MANVTIDASVPAQRGESSAPEPASLTQRLEAGRARREQVARSSHADWSPAANRPDPLDLLERQAEERLREVVPIRYGRMAGSPFSFLRGSAVVMAADLAATPVSGFEVQACGDAHVANFGVFATPERRLVFDLNDFDETLPGPWEWDVKRLAASLVVCGRQRRMTNKDVRDATMTALRAYSAWMHDLAARRTLDVWYARIDTDAVLDALRGADRKALEKGLAKARSRDHLQAQAKLTELVDGQRRIVLKPPLVSSADYETDKEFLQQTFADYVASLPRERHVLLHRYRVADVARMVVGVGSVGTRCFLVLCQGRGDDDPLLLQIKEAVSSVLEPYLGPSAFANHGERVVQGQRVMQAASDIFLGWIRGSREGRDYYCRQLRDMKGSAKLDTISPRALSFYAGVCGAALARAHGRSGDPALIAGYLGTSDAFATAVTEFACRYADQTVIDHAALLDAVHEGRVPASMI